MNDLIVLDVSRYQSMPDGQGGFSAYMDFEKAAEAGAVAVAIRCTVGNYYKDPCFEVYWEKAKAAGLLVSAYHVVTPEYSAESQITWFMSLFGSRVPDFEIVMDCELSRGQTPDTITNRIKGCLDLFEKHVYECMIYTRGNWWRENVRRRDYWKDYSLWIARYNDYIDHPWDDDPATDPLDWDEWELWQWSADNNGKGAEFGSAGDDDIDLSRVRDEEFFDYEPGNGEPGNGGVVVGNLDELKAVVEYLEGREIPAMVNVNYTIGLSTDSGNGLNGGNGDGGDGDAPGEPPGDGDDGNGDPEYPANAEPKVIGVYEFDHDGGHKDKEPFVYKFVSWKKTKEEKPPYGVWNISKVKVGNSIWKLAVGTEVLVSAHKQPVSPDEMCLHNLVQEWYDHGQGKDEHYYLDVGNCKNR